MPDHIKKDFVRVSMATEQLSVNNTLNEQLTMYY